MASCEKKEDEVEPMKKMFVSSTFMDMQLERDSLKKRIVPDLNMRLREYGKIGRAHV